jgi:hypothetical protein
MISNENYEAQKDEIELLKNILFELLSITAESPNFKLEISISPDVVEEPKLKFKLNLNLPDEYPNHGPIFEVLDLSNYLASSKIKTVGEKIKIFVEENLGMPMMYQIYEIVKEFGNEQEEIMQNEALQKINIEEESRKKYNEKVQMMERCLIETKTFTPVTKENFEVWFKKYYAEQNKGKDKKWEQDQRLSGREHFMKMKMSNTGEYKDADINETDDKEDDINGNNQESIENTKDSAIYFDAEAFEENIDDIDFDGADIDEYY